ncbi:phage major tail tube protein [Lentisphaerota bacterium ZTH]|nr:phage major tail tube protein [Lentisphaerota bacterium]WET05832.1 phage major tail tube protein [Lentisphaerota bacterium ZTH]
MLDNILANCNVFVDGKGYAGKCEELSLPKLTLKTEEFRGGGMDAPVEIDMGMEKLEAAFDLNGYESDVLKFYGVADGNKVPLRFKGAQRQSDGAIKPVDIEMTGMLKEIDMGSWKAGERAKTKYTMNLNYYKFSLDGNVIYEIDIMNNIRKINGKDQKAAERKAIGM